jgi:hypothetical protein
MCAFESKSAMLFERPASRGKPARDHHKKKPVNPFGLTGLALVEAAGQLIHGFRHGLDYAFILLPGCGASYSPKTSSES